MRLIPGEDDLIHALGQILEDLGLRGDGIAEEVTAAGTDSGFCQSFVAFHKNSF